MLIYRHHKSSDISYTQKAKESKKPENDEEKKKKKRKKEEKERTLTKCNKEVRSLLWPYMQKRWRAKSANILIYNSLQVG